MLCHHTCKNNHSWFKCPVHDIICLGEPDHSLSIDICQCKHLNSSDRKDQNWYPTNQDILAYNSTLDYERALRKAVKKMPKKLR